MSRKKPKNNRPSTPSRPAQEPPPPSQTAARVTEASVSPADPTASAVQALETLHSEAFEGASEADLEKVLAEGTAPIEPGVGDALESIRQALSRAQEARSLFLARAARTEETAAEADRRLAAVEARETTASTKEGELDRRASELSETERKVGELEASWRSKYEDIARREAEIEAQKDALMRGQIEASAGFAAQRREALKQLVAETDVLRDEMARHRAQIAAERAAWERERAAAAEMSEAELRARQSELERKQRMALDAERAALADQEKAIERERAELRAERKSLDAALRRVTFDKEDLDELKRDLNRRIEERVAAREDQLRGSQLALQERLAAAQAAREHLESILAARHDADLRFGHRTPEEALQEIELLNRERDELRAQLSARPGDDAVRRLAQLEKERDAWTVERTRLVQENQELKADVARCRIAVTEIETLRDQKTTLERSRDLTRAALEELRRDVDERVRRADGASAFPACSKMDASDTLGTRVPCEERILSLAEFARDLRDRIASPPPNEKRLYYSMADVRSFLGGLASSRLLLLQGISGTGKTSLPRAFARVVGGKEKVIPVQAGWRDRHDILGHYNSFKSEYHEMELLQALYEAQCPRFEDILYVVVLDEMNLSHPEHYFADFLSALELADPKQREIELMPASTERAPKLLREGRKLALPPNVWFVGTANHDETTKDFADKTYDRAHVMELPRQREVFTPSEPQPRRPIGVGALERAFEEARKTHRNRATQANEFLDKKFAALLADRFQIGWGNRLEQQMESYIPAVMAAGGSIGEATDHILATKLLRKIRNRHDLRPADLTTLQGSIKKTWDVLDTTPEGAPWRSLALVAREIQRIGAAEEE